MSYKQDLATLHSQRMARLWPVGKVTSPVTQIRALNSEIDALRAQKAKLEAEVAELTCVRDWFVGDKRLITLRVRICLDNEISEHALVSPARSNKLNIARRQFAQEARALGASLPRIAYHLGGRSHTTVLHYLDPTRKKRGKKEPMVG